MSKLYLLYIPGLGDNNPQGQIRAVRTWRCWGVQSELIQMNWADREAWQTKFDRILRRIDELAADGWRIGLVGASAGGSAVINAYAARQKQVSGVVLIAGKVNRPGAIGASYHRRNPAFVQSAQDCQQALADLDAEARKRILSRYALIDEVVYKPDSRIPGAHNQLVPSIGHAITIASQLIFGAPSFIRFLKRQTI